MTGPFLTFFPQFCRDPINDGAWYPGFTDWDLIRQLEEPLRSRFLPAAGCYDLADQECISRQFSSVRSSAWPAMALYHYFFDGRFVLNGVERFILDGREPVPPFFIIWANESWSKRWIGKPRQIILRQHHSLSRECVTTHVRRLATLFRHPSYARENGRPIFVLYAPFDIPGVSEFLRTYRRAFAEADVDPLIGFCVPYIDPTFDGRDFDFCVEFQPRLFINVMRSRHRGWGMRAAIALKNRVPWVFDHVTGAVDRVRRGRSQPSISLSYQEYLDLVEKDYFVTALEQAYRLPVRRGLFFSWNNYPRYRGSAVQVTHRDGDYAAFVRLAEQMKAKQGWFLLNSWNEWSEGAALEPGLQTPDLYERIEGPG